MSTTVVSPKELQELHEAGTRVHLIDVRTPVEFREVHAEPAENVPLDRLDARAVMTSRGISPGETVYLICRSGNRARMAAERFLKAGCADVVNVEGGTEAWEAAGLPVVRGRKAMSLERQVRIAAGSLVLAGAVLGYFVHPWWIALSGFVGAGLVFAGITDTCGMGILLSKMPWNQVRGACEGACEEVRS